MANNMNPFELFHSPGIYKVAVLYFSKSRGLAIVGRGVAADAVEVVQLSGEVDPRTGEFVALDYNGSVKLRRSQVLSRKDFDRLISFIASRIDDQTRMSVIEPDLMRSLQSQDRAEERPRFLQ